MHPFRKILVPVDLASESRSAVAAAAAIARRYEASVDLFHSWQPPALVPIDLLVMPHAGHVSVGDAAHDICDLATKGGYDLIVMATHGRTGLSHALLGSVTEKVLRHAPCPGLAVRGTTTA